jgi:hypothetical protein
MIPHHAAAVAMARLELKRDISPQAKALAEQIITGQNMTILTCSSTFAVQDRGVQDAGGSPADTDPGARRVRTTSGIAHPSFP